MVKQIIGTVDYIRELPIDITVKEWLQMHKISNNLKHGKQECVLDKEAKLCKAKK